MSEMRGKPRGRTVVVVALMVAALVLGACGDSDDDGGSAAGGAEPESGGNEVSQAEGSGSDPMAAPSDLSAGEAGGTGGLGSFQIDLTADDRVFGSPKVIKNGRVGLRVERDAFDEAVDEVYFLATRLEGIVKSTAIDDSEEGRGTVVIRIPSDRFEDALTQLRDIGRIESQYVDTQDVTDEFVDLESRIRNARSAERVLLGLMNEAASIADTIRVQRQLERVQENIERMRGRLRVLEDETSFSTLAVDVTEAGAPKEEEPKAGTLGKAWNDAVDGFMGVISAVIVASGVLLPVAVLALIVVLLVRRLLPGQA